MNTYGEWFDAAFSQPLPLLAGPKGSEKEMLAAYLAFKQVLQPVGVLPEELKLSARRAWQVKLDNSVILSWGARTSGCGWAAFCQLARSTVAPAVQD